MKFCVECGRKLEDDTKFCPSCGKKQPSLEEDNLFDNNENNINNNENEDIKEEINEENNDVILNNNTITIEEYNDENKGKASLVLGILSIIFSLLLVSSPIGLILGIIGLLTFKNGRYKSLNAIGIIIFLVEAIILLIGLIIYYLSSI